MCDLHATGSSCEQAEPAPAGSGRTLSRRHVLGAVAASAATVTAGSLAGRGTVARAASGPSSALSVTLLGTNGGPPPLAARSGISSVLVAGGRSYVVDCGRGAVSQFVRAGLPVTSLAGIFLTHLHSDHTVDYFSFLLLLANGNQITQPFDVYGPGPAGEQSLVPPSPA